MSSGLAFLPSRTDRFFFLIGILGVILFTYLLFFYQPKVVENAGRAIARIEVDGAVKRRFGRSLRWWAIKNSQSVYENDAIYTPTSSVATLVILANNDRIRLKPNSLVKFVEVGSGEIELFLERGAIEVEREGKLVSVTGTAAKIAIRKSGMQVTSTGEVASVTAMRGLAPVAVAENVAIVTFEPLITENVVEAVTVVEPVTLGNSDHALALSKTNTPTAFGILSLDEPPAVPASSSIIPKREVAAAPWPGKLPEAIGVAPVQMAQLTSPQTLLESLKVASEDVLLKFSTMISVAPGIRFLKVRSESVTSGTFAELIGKPSLAIFAEISRRLTEYFSVSASYEFSKLDFYGADNYTIANPAALSRSGITATYSLNDRWRMRARAQYEQHPYVESVSSTAVNVEAIWIAKASADVSFDLVQSRRFLVSLEGGGGVLLPQSGQNINLGMGYHVYGQLLLGKLFDRPRLQSALVAEHLSQGSTNFNQKMQRYGLEVSMDFDF